MRIEVWWLNEALDQNTRTMDIKFLLNQNEAGMEYQMFYLMTCHSKIESKQFQMWYITAEMYLSNLMCQVLSLKIAFFLILMACESLNGFSSSFSLLSINN